MKDEQPGKPARLEWVIHGSFFAMCHFLLFALLGVLFGYVAPWVAYPLALFALVAESALKATSVYHGQDSLQWPIIVMNSLLYGFGVYWLFSRWRRARPVA